MCCAIGPGLLVVLSALLIGYAPRAETIPDPATRRGTKDARTVRAEPEWVVGEQTAENSRSLVPKRQVNPDDYTAFVAVDATLSDGLVPSQSGGHGKFPIKGWTRSAQRAEWVVHAATADEYEVRVAIRSDACRSLRVSVSVSGNTVGATLPANSSRGWDRLELKGLLPLPAGSSTLTLRIVAEDETTGFDAEVHAVELVRPSVRADLGRRALGLRSDPTWFQKARHGVMVHWTSQSVPLRGEPVSYDKAVEAFDVDRFASEIERTGAGFVVFTTSHAYQYFPAPLISLDRVLPGRTSRRDLIADLAAALTQRNIKLMLYFHLGTSEDREWTAATAFFDSDSSKLFSIWREIISEAGDRYGDRLAGWWFDDGSTSYYYRSPPWESLALAAKAGNPRRLIAFNAWELISPTQFQDFCTGEGCQEPRGFCGVLKPGGDGRYPSGTHAGLQASACLLMETNWGHFTRDTPLSKPKWSPDELTHLLNGFISCKNVPIFNLEISQDGALSQESLRLFERVLSNL